MLKQNAQRKPVRGADGVVVISRGVGEEKNSLRTAEDWRNDVVVAELIKPRKLIHQPYIQFQVYNQPLLMQGWM